MNELPQVPVIIGPECRFLCEGLFTMPLRDSENPEQDSHPFQTACDLSVGCMWGLLNTTALHLPGPGEVIPELTCTGQTIERALCLPEMVVLAETAFRRRNNILLRC